MTEEIELVNYSKQEKVKVAVSFDFKIIDAGQGIPSPYIHIPRWGAPTLLCLLVARGVENALYHTIGLEEPWGSQTKLPEAPKVEPHEPIVDDVGLCEVCRKAVFSDEDDLPSSDS